MSMTFNSDPKIPLALLMTLALHLGGVIWWASAKDRDTQFLERRVTGLESSTAQAATAQSGILERLAHIEERLTAEAAILERIEKQLAQARR